ncbi:hypothetical protein LIER_27160 [Lithospermum erythrorhizon]|uniref:Uncharacterized protein n=1 Tax=Lithospermum erythrorhizon TaxID=34254 RepID=A0AAV3RB23_LITER
MEYAAPPISLSLPEKSRHRSFRNLAFKYFCCPRNDDCHRNRNLGASGDTSQQPFHVSPLTSASQVQDLKKRKLDVMETRPSVWFLLLVVCPSLNLELVNPKSTCDF